MERCKLRRFLALVAVFAIGCSGPVREDDSHATARRLIANLKSGTEQDVMAILAPETKSQAAGKIPQLQALAATIRLDSLILLDTRRAWSTDFEHVEILFQAPTDTGWAIITVDLNKAKNAYEVLGFHINLLSNEQYHSNDFSFDKMTFVQFLILAYCLSVVLLNILSIVLCIRSNFKRKWLWIIGIILSLPSISFNWSTTEVGFQLLKFTLLGFSFLRYPLTAPWMLQTTVPIVTIIFLVKWYIRRSRSSESGGPAGLSGSVAA